MKEFYIRSTAIVEMSIEANTPAEALHKAKDLWIDVFDEGNLFISIDEPDIMHDSDTGQDYELDGFKLMPKPDLEVLL